MTLPRKSAKKINAKKSLLFVAAAAGAALFAVVPASHALVGTDKLDLGVMGSNETKEGDKTDAGLRVLSEDGLENLGVGSAVKNQTSEGEQTNLGTKAEATDTLQNVAGGVTAENETKEGDKQGVNAGVKTEDTLNKVNGGVDVINEQDGDKQNAGINFSFE